MSASSTRIALSPLTIDVVRERLRQDEFTADLPPHGRVAFDAEWPGDLLPLFEMFVRVADTDVVPGQFVMIDIDRAAAVGATGVIGDTTPTGTLEIGYGVNPSERRNGHATAAVARLLDALADGTALGRPVHVVTANTAVGNRASERVLEHNGFVRTGTTYNNEDGDLITLRRGPSTA